jgi:hypothetical membrane protein
MNWNTQRPYIIAAPVAFAIIILGIIISAPLDTKWDILGSYDLSDLGKYTTRTLACALVFNFSCFISGILILLFGVGKYRFEKGVDKVAGFFFMTCGLGLFLVGILTADNPTSHNVAAGIFAISMSTAVVLATVSDIIKGNRLILISSIIILIALVGGWIVFELMLDILKNARSELLAICCAAAWFMVQIYKYNEEGKLSPDYETVPE